MALSLTREVYDLLKRRIVRYEIKPGIVITSKQVAASLRVSQTPVREAFCILEHEKLIERVHKKGFSISALTLKNVKDLYDLRIGIEVFAAEKAANSARQADITRLGDILERLQLCINNADKGQILELEQAVHMTILEATTNLELIETGRRILDRIWMLQKIVLYSSEHWSESQRQHMEIFEALKEADHLNAVSLMKKHLAWGKDLVISRLHDKDDFFSKIVIDNQENLKALQRN